MPALASSQAFGRFGYTDRWEVPGVVLSREGFRTEGSAADTFRFAAPLRQWKPAATNEWSQTVQTGEFAGNPSKLRHDLTALGFSAYFGQGMRLLLRSTNGPILTWADGSMEANTGYATPPTKWVVVSFRDAQPPMLFAFLDKEGALRLTGRTGEWVLSSEGDLGTWVRICAPLGNRAFPTNTVADLGKLKAACLPAVELAARPSPSLTYFSAIDEGPGVLGEWTFDAPGAVVPFPAFLSSLGGYGVLSASKTKRLDMNTQFGPVFVTDEPKLALRFLVRRVPTGRAVTVGSALGQGIGTASFLDVPTVTELALANLVASQDRAARELANGTVSEFLTETNYYVEPNTQQRLPFDGPGQGLDLTAAHALLLQSTISTARATSEPNSLLTSLAWRRDWLTWQYTGAEAAKRRRAAALSALAYALAPEPERRVESGMLQAGLAAERGLAVWKHRTQGAPPPPKFLEAMFEVREDLFGKDDYRRKTGFGRTLLSELRAFGDVPIECLVRDKKLILRWKAPDTRVQTISLAAGYPLTIAAGQNVADLQSSQGLGITILRVTPKAVGLCEATLSLPEWADPLPAFQAPPRFEESER